MSQSRGFIGSGDVFLNPYDPDTGLQTGMVYGGDADKFAIKPNSEIKERESRGRDTAGQVLATVARQKPAELSITFAEVNRDNMALCFMGKAAEINTAAGNVVAGAVTFKTKAGKATGAKLPHGNIKSAGFALKNGATTYVLDTDYKVNWRLGIILPIAGAALATAIEADADGSYGCTADYDYGAVGGVQIRGAVVPQLRTEIYFDGKNEVDGSPAIVHVYEATLTPQAEFDFLSSDYNDLQLQGRMQTPIGKNEPFTVDLPEFA